MGNNATSYALIRPDGKVETFIKLDLPESWTPQEGYSIVPNDELPSNWEMAPSEPAQIPQTISARQIRLWLIQHNYTLSQIDNIINQIPDELQKNIVMVEWEYAPYVERHHPWINVLGAALGLNSQEIDQAFIEASVL